MHNTPESKTKLYIKKVPIFWWTKRWVDIRFIARELTSVFVAGYSIVFIFYIRAVSRGPEAYAQFSDSLTSPAIVFLHVFALVALLYHSITWFNLAPKAMVIKIGENRVPGILVAIMNYAGWVTISIAIIWLASNG